MKKSKSYTSSNAYLSARVEDLTRDKEGRIREIASLVCRQFSKTMDIEGAWETFLESIKNAFQVGEAISEKELRPVFQSAWNDRSMSP